MTTNTLLGIIAVSLSVIAFDTVSANPSLVPSAMAQPVEDEGGRVSAAEQRKVIIAELRTLSSKVEKLDAHIAKGISVKVLEMPRVAEPKQ
jgi:hypothetical protein